MLSDFAPSALHLLRGLAWKHQIGFHALDDPEWSRDAFIARHGAYRGGLRYLFNRASQLDDGEGATSRWCTKICNERAVHSGRNLDAVRCAEKSLVPSL